MGGEYGGKLERLSWILWEASITATVLENICQFANLPDTKIKGTPKEWWKVEPKEKENKIPIKPKGLCQTKEECPSSSNTAAAGGERETQTEKSRERKPAIEIEIEIEIEIQIQRLY